MDTQTIIKQFDEIEQRVDGLIGVCKTQEATILDLKTKIRDLEEEVRIKAEAEKQFTAERDAIRSKIDVLLGRLEDISEA